MDLEESITDSAIKKTELFEKLNKDTEESITESMVQSELFENLNKNVKGSNLSMEQSKQVKKLNKNGKKHVENVPMDIFDLPMKQSDLFDNLNMNVEESITCSSKWRSELFKITNMDVDILESIDMLRMERLERKAICSYYEELTQASEESITDLSMDQSELVENRNKGVKGPICNLRMEQSEENKIRIKYMKEFVDNVSMKPSEMYEKIKKHLKNVEEMKKYEDSWSEERWREEMEKYSSFFTVKPVADGDKITPLMTELKKIPYNPKKYTAEELASVYLREGNHYAQNKNFNLALKFFKSGIEIKCGDKDLNAKLHANQAAVHLYMRNYKKALSEVMETRKYIPDHTRSLHRGALCHSRLKDFQKCYAWCKEGLRIRPNDETLRKFGNWAKKKYIEKEHKKKADAEKKFKINISSEKVSEGIAIILGGKKDCVQELVED